MTQETQEVLAQVERGWIQDHGYAVIYRCADGGVLCGTCVQTEKVLVLDATKENFDADNHVGSDIKQWAVVGVETTQDYDVTPTCSNCGKDLGA